MCIAILMDNEIFVLRFAFQFTLISLLSQESVSWTCHIRGPSLTSATVNHPTHIIIELTDSDGRPWPLTATVNITAQLELATPPQAKETPFWRLWLKKKEAKPTCPTLPHCVQVTMESPCQYKVSYTAVCRGLHKLHVQVNEREVKDSPFIVTVYLKPTQLGHPIRVVSGLAAPYGIAHNSQEEMIISECWGHRVSIFKISEHKKIRTFGLRGNRPQEMIQPAVVATDGSDNIYVNSCHKLQKFTSSGELIKCTGEKGKKKGEFDDPRGLTIHKNEVYVCDSNNHRIQIFDLNLNFVQSIGSYGKERGEFITPRDVKFDAAGNMYVSEQDNSRVQVMDKQGQSIQTFGEGKLQGASGLHIADKYVYVCDWNSDCIVVYETSGEFVTSFGRPGQNKGEFCGPCSITFCVNGCMYVCDYWMKRVQIF